VEHGFSDHEEMIRKLRTIKGYQPLFKKSFGTDQITIDRVGKAIASFQRTLLSGNSPYDRFDYGGEENALSQGAQRGLKLFLKKARCTRCHSGFNFTDEKFHNLGIDWDTDHADLGRFKVTGNSEEIGAFKTPTLREIARTAPYMHDGRFATLREVVEFYNRGGIKNPHQDSLVIPLELSEQEKLDLVKFLQALNGEGWQTKPPEKFPM
jgi:cytochrome c peroxidase